MWVISHKLTTPEFNAKLSRLYGDQFELLSEYINNETKVILRCSKCGSIIKKRPSKMTSAGREGCYVCAGKNHFKTKESLQRELDERYPGDYEVLGDYIGARTPIMMKRLRCGHIQKISPDNALRGKGCPMCSNRQSHYMDIVESYLQDHQIEYEKEKCFDGCKNKRRLPFDYYIPFLNTCIEVDGEYHFPRTNVQYSNPHAQYEQVAARDSLKTRFCEENDIRLVRLPYYLEDSFADILDQELYANTEITH